MKAIDCIETETAGAVRVYDFKLPSREREKELAKKYPLTDPAKRQEAEELRRRPLNVPITEEAAT